MKELGVLSPTGGRPHSPFLFGMVNAALLSSMAVAESEEDTSGVTSILWTRHSLELAAEM